MRILIAEDDFIGRKVLQTYLQQHGTCDIAINGMEAVDLFLRAKKEGKPYDLICLDIMMPIMDGIAVLKTIRNIENGNVSDKDEVIERQLVQEKNRNAPEGHTLPDQKATNKQKQTCGKQNVKIIITSALNDRKTMATTFDSGCEAYVWKPIDINKFHDTMVKLGLLA